MIDITAYKISNLKRCDVINKRFIIAGPCSFSSYEEIIKIAKELKLLGVSFLRAGAFKPRTSPYTFQGLRDEGMQILQRVKEETGLKLVVEMLSWEQANMYKDIVDIIQVGSRNMYNYDFLEKLGTLQNIILLKRGMSATVEEWLNSAEYIAKSGNENIILCERGIRGFDNVTRNVLDLQSVVVVKNITKLPVIVDPSHASGDKKLVLPMSLAAISCGCDGLEIEVHSDPENSVTDANQTISIEDFAKLLKHLDKEIFMEKEKRDLYDKDSKLTGLTYYKGDPRPEGYYPMVVMIAIQNSKGEFLMQKRVPRKGGDWGVTGGHPKSGQTTDEGIITEVEEELGIDIRNEKLETFCAGCDGKDCYKMYYLKKDLDISEITIQEDELTEVRWFSMKKLEDMVKSGELNQDQIDFFLKCSDYLKNRK